MKQREYGLDLARILSMLGILLLHIIGRGGLLGCNEPTSVRYWVYWAVEIFAYSSVDLFAMLTGWLDVNRTSKSSTFRIIELLSITLSYSVIITLLFTVFCPEKVIGIKGVVKGILPMVVGRYWYITCYIPLAILKPYLRDLLSELTAEKHKKVCMILIVVFSIIPSLTMIDWFVVKWGYSTIWLFVCYVIGSYLYKIRDSVDFSPYKLGGGYIAVPLFLLILKGILWGLTGGSVGGIVEYTSPFVLLHAVVGLLLFSKLHISKGKKVLRNLSNVAFDVYIIHCHIFVFDYIINSNFLWIDEYPILIVPFVLLGVTVICYSVLSFVGVVRNYIFVQCKIGNIIGTIARKIDKIIY